MTSGPTDTFFYDEGKSDSKKSPSDPFKKDEMFLSMLTSVNQVVSSGDMTLPVSE